MAATIPTNGLGVDAGLDIAGGNLTFTTADKGVHLGVTSATAANLMDDYEEGTFTPTLNGSAGAPSGVSYSVRTGSYVKVGNVVTVHCYLQSSSMTSVPSGGLTVTGLPFTIKDLSNSYPAAVVGYCTNFATTEAPQAGYGSNDTTIINMTGNGSNDARNNLNDLITCSNAMSGDEILLVSMTYRST